MTNTLTISAPNSCEAGSGSNIMQERSMMKNPWLILFLAAFFIAGAAVTFIGAKDIYVKNVLSRDWNEVEAVYAGSKPYRGKNVKYFLYYSYVAGGSEYTVMTDYTNRTIPEQGSTKTIKYDPDNPANAVFAAHNANVPLFIAGLVFVAFPLVFIAFMFRKVNISKILFGIIFAMFGFIFCYTELSIVFGVIFTAAGIFIISDVIRPYAISIVKAIKARKHRPES